MLYYGIRDLWEKLRNQTLQGGISRSKSVISLSEAVVQWVNQSVVKSEESSMPRAGVEPYSKAGGKSVESCCLCIATSSVVFSQGFGGGPAGAVWSARCNQEELYAEQGRAETWWNLPATLYLFI